MIVVAIGSNIDPAIHVPRAVGELAQKFGLLECSPAIETPAIDRPEQADYWNAVVRFESDLPKPEIHAILREMEAQHGRVRGPDKWAARTLDLDIVQFGFDIDEEVGERDFLAAIVAALDGASLDDWNVVWSL